MPATRFHQLTDGRRIAFRHIAGSSPAVIFLPGYMSDMAGGKATALAEWAAAEGRECLLLDYSGCGESGGDFGQGTLTRWREEVVALTEAHVPGKVVLVGSSMGGWLMLLVAQRLGERLAGLVGPRPHAIGSLAGDKLFWEVDQRYWHRHSLRPVLTGLAQIRGLRGATDHESDLSSRLQSDLEYLVGWTIFRDVRILFATVGVLVHDRAF